ncbi:hypothetical protein CPB83DRAFT_252389 [Crepidotus variabilis]|uniref:F-box domain-containing protein n=1 Tax=Crepidotus variabilis TaxID=179855 RepID=A0A9P6EIN6_9AGAR|nr:hypothetical protein CPB83DRAFT_252389 [Crepidotus variabilis]
MLAQAIAFQQLAGTIAALLPEQNAEQVHSKFAVCSQQSVNNEGRLKLTPRVASRPQALRLQSEVVRPTRRYITSYPHPKRLPAELWQYIFQYACAGWHPFYGPSIGKPVRLSTVCSSWRHIVTNMPELWTSLHFDEEAIRRPSQKLRAAQTYFSRARGLPLSFTVTETSNTEPSINFIKSVIISFSQTFRFLHLVLPISQLQELLLLPEGSLDSLEEFHIAPSHEKLSLSFPTQSQRATVFGRTSRLRRMRLKPRVSRLSYLVTLLSIAPKTSRSNLQHSICQPKYFRNQSP